MWRRQVILMHINDVALRHLSGRSRTVREMKQHLEDKGFPEEEISVLIEEFCAYGYLDDEQYCRAYFRYAFGKGKGCKKVFAELGEKGVDSQLIRCVYEDFSQEEEDLCDEKARARAEAQKVLRLADISAEEVVPEKIRGRIARKLQRKGYGSQTIYTILGELQK